MKAITAEEVLRQVALTLACTIVVAWVMRRAPLLKGLTVY